MTDAQLEVLALLVHGKCRVSNRTNGNTVNAAVARALVRQGLAVRKVETKVDDQLGRPITYELDTVEITDRGRAEYARAMEIP